MSNLDKLYELESLVKNNGDKERIQQLRIELGFDPLLNKEDWNEKKYDFTVDGYIELKAKGMADKDIQKEYGISKSTLIKYKKQAGLTREKIKQLIREYYKVS